MSDCQSCTILEADHRVIERHLDAMFTRLSRLTPELVTGAQAEFDVIRRLSARHFDREEKIFYPYLRPLFPDLLAKLDEQHGHIRELEQHIIDSLERRSEPPDARWLDEFRSLGIQFHDLIQHHIIAEEEQLLRLADENVPPHEDVILAGRMNAI